MKIGLTASAFDLLHAGHVQMLEEAKTQCDYLICALHIDPSTQRSEKGKPVQNMVERYTQLKAVKYVDEIIPYATENELEDILELYPINVRIIGEEYERSSFTGDWICDRKGIEIYYNKREHRFSTKHLRKNILWAESDFVR
jgi:glycerol-3-phosphate cytidylyltransferase